LQPARRYTLQLVDAGGKRLADPWPLKTFPSVDARSDSLRVLMYTCPGGHDVLKRFLRMPLRIRLIERALSFEPDVLIANGDQVYWDLRSRIATTRSGRAPAALAYAGDFDRTIPVLGTPNESVLKRAVGPQIAPLYGTRCRSIPVFFMRDDHDYFDNDEADDRLVTSRPTRSCSARRAPRSSFTTRNSFPRRTARSACPAPARPIALQAPRKASARYATASSRSSSCTTAADTSRSRESAGFVPLDVETWLARRVAADEHGPPHQVPSTPIGWSAGEWGEWYADVERNALSRPK